MFTRHEAMPTLKFENQQITSKRRDGIRGCSRYLPKSAVANTNETSSPIVCNTITAETEGTMLAARTTFRQKRTTRRGRARSNIQQRQSSAFKMITRKFPPDRRRQRRRATNLGTSDIPGALLREKKKNAETMRKYEHGGDDNDEQK